MLSLVLLATAYATCPPEDALLAADIPATNLGETLVDFPFPVPMGFDSGVTADPESLVVAGEDGVLLPVEPELSVDSEGVLWVRLDELHADQATRIYLCEGSGGATPVRTDVWSNGFHLVYHLTDPELNSVTGDHEGVVLGGDAIDGLVGGAWDFDGGNDGIDTQDDTHLEAYTIEAWALADALPSTTRTSQRCRSADT